MSRNLETNFLNSLNSESYRLSYLVKIEFDEGTLAFSSSLHDITYAGQVYQGFGTLGNVSRLEEDSKLSAQQYTVTLSAVKDTILNAVRTSNYINRPCTCYLASLDDQGQIIGTPAVYFSGKIDNLNCEYGNTGALQVIVTDDLVRWDVPKVRNNTDSDQQSIWPGDRGFEFVAELSEKVIVWPDREWFKNNRD